LTEYLILPLEITRWIDDSVGVGAEIRSSRRLTGATSSTLYGVEAARNGRPLKLVLRLFTNAEWLAEEPDLVRHEAANLEKAVGADVPAPELVACDESGAHCGVPAILMTQLPGRVELMPADLDDWLYKLAEAIIPLHTLDVGAGQGVLAPFIAKAQARYTGVDISSRLLQFARRHHGKHGRFILGDARELAKLPELRQGEFDAVVFLLSIQDMDPLHAVFESTAWVLGPGGRAVILITHPCFRVPRQSGWGWDEGRKVGIPDTER
jgi:SAM-dependent methyltransferase